MPPQERANMYKREHDFRQAINFNKDTINFNLRQIQSRIRKCFPIGSEVVFDYPLFPVKEGVVSGYGYGIINQTKEIDTFIVKVKNNKLSEIYGTAYEATMRVCDVELKDPSKYKI